MRFAVLFSLTAWLWFGVAIERAFAQMAYSPPAYTDAQAQAANAASIAAAQANAIALSQPQLLTSIPTSGPGLGLCLRAYVPSGLTFPPGTTGTCSLIEMCGTSVIYNIITTNTGNGC